jgi:hypothetical protein
VFRTFVASKTRVSAMLDWPPIAAREESVSSPVAATPLTRRKALCFGNIMKGGLRRSSNECDDHHLSLTAGYVTGEMQVPTFLHGTSPSIVQLR